MKMLVMIIVIGSVMLSTNLGQAQEIGSKEDNACNAGGSMAGKCDTDWEWVCGWYLARWENAGGWLTPNNVINTACQSLLPPVVPEEAAGNNGPFCEDIAGWWGCLLGNIFTFDVAPVDGIVDDYYAIAEVCPPDGLFLHPVGSTFAALQIFLNKYGFDDSLAFCAMPLLG